MNDLKEEDVVEEATSYKKDVLRSYPETLFGDGTISSQEHSEAYYKVTIQKFEVSETNLKNEIHCDMHNITDETTGRNDSSVEHKINIKEEIDIVDKSLPNDKKLCSTYHKRIYGSSSRISRGELEVDEKVIKEEMDILDMNSPNESVCFPTDFEKILNNDTVTAEFEMYDNAELKDWALLSNVDFQNEQKFFTRDLLKYIKKESITFEDNTEASVAEISTETVCRLKAPASNFLPWSEHTEKNMEELELAVSSGMVAIGPGFVNELQHMEKRKF